MESGANKYYRGLPVTTSALIFPLFYLLRPLLPGKLFVMGLYLLAAVTAFLFVLDFKVKKPNLGKMPAMK